ncbi:hypothetical protein LTR17_000051 [Elasticomyces elasticus]|nr:hypothetical protein LTR17_000051 [Elasticomyces elasticus]
MAGTPLGDPFSDQVNDNDEFESSIISVVATTIVRAYLINRSRRNFAVEGILLHYTGILTAADVPGANNKVIPMRKAVATAAKWLNEWRYQAALLKNKESRTNTLAGFLNNGIWAGLPAELRNLVVVKLGESASTEARGHIIELKTGEDFDRLCDRLMPTVWQKRLGYTETLRRTVLETHIFAPAMSVQEIPGIPLALSTIPFQNTNNPVLHLALWTSMRRLAQYMERLDLVLHVTPHRNMYSGIHWPIQLFAYVDSIRTMITQHFPALQSLSITINDSTVDDFNLGGRNLQVLWPVQYTDELTRLLDILSSIELKEVRTRFLPTKPSTATFKRYSPARQAIMCAAEDEGNWMVQRRDEQGKVTESVE